MTSLNPGVSDSSAGPRTPRPGRARAQGWHRPGWRGRGRPGSCPSPGPPHAGLRGFPVPLFYSSTPGPVSMKVLSDSPKRRRCLRCGNCCKWQRRHRPAPPRQGSVSRVRTGGSPPPGRAPEVTGAAAPGALGFPTLSRWLARVTPLTSPWRCPGSGRTCQMLPPSHLSLGLSPPAL